jgi:protein gp37
MGENSKIEWTDHTFNPWLGCTKVAPGCKHCYAESLVARFNKAAWGPNGTRVKTSREYWRQPLKWNRDAEKVGERQRVFCASLADVFEDWQGPIHGSGFDDGKLAIDDDRSRLLTLDDLRRDLFALIDSTLHLDWLLLTKRPENIPRMWQPREATSNFRQNVWLGTSVSHQTTADSLIPALSACRDLAPVLFASYEPALGPVDFTRLPHLDWIIVGGESGHQSRPFHIAWAESTIEQCRSAGVAVFMKQLGAHIHTSAADYGWGTEMVPFYVSPEGRAETRDEFPAGYRVKVRHPKGGDMDEWPAALRIRQFPEPS